MIMDWATLHSLSIGVDTALMIAAGPSNVYATASGLLSPLQPCVCVCMCVCANVLVAKKYSISNRKLYLFHSSSSTDRCDGQNIVTHHLHSDFPSSPKNVLPPLLSSPLLLLLLHLLLVRFSGRCQETKKTCLASYIQHLHSPPFHLLSHGCGNFYARDSGMVTYFTCYSQLFSPSLWSNRSDIFPLILIFISCIYECFLCNYFLFSSSLSSPCSSYAYPTTAATIY